jgi:hypothetical protein
MLEIYLTEKTTEQKQNFHSSTTPACTEHLHLTLNGETRSDPVLPPDCIAQTAWDDADHKVS